MAWLVDDYCITVVISSWVVRWLVYYATIAVMRLYVGAIMFGVTFDVRFQ